MKERGEEREDGENVQLGDGEQLRGVHVVPVTQLVGWSASQRAVNRVEQVETRTEDGLDFLGLALFDERVEYDDVFALSQRI